METWWIYVGCSISQIDASSWQFTHKTGDMCAGFRWRTWFWSSEEKTSGPSPGHKCYITSTTQSPVSLLNLRSLLSSAVKIAPMFLGILRISVIGPYNLFFLCSQRQILDLPPTLLVANMRAPTQLKSSESNGDTEWTSALFTLNFAHLHWMKVSPTWVFSLGRGNERECGLTDSVIASYCVCVRQKLNLNLST